MCFSGGKYLLVAPVGGQMTFKQLTTFRKKNGNFVQEIDMRCAHRAKHKYSITIMQKFTAQCMLLSLGLGLEKHLKKLQEQVRSAKTHPLFSASSLYHTHRLNKKIRGVATHKISPELDVLSPYLQQMLVICPVSSKSACNSFR